MVINVVLHRPLIHWNTGNVGRTCLGLGARLHLVRPFGFELDDKHVKRAGLDYWPHVDLTVHESWESLEPKLPSLGSVYFLSKQAQHGEENIVDIKFPRQKDICLIFGNEVEGLKGVSSDYLANSRKLYFPMNPAIRSYNLSTTVAMTLFEVYRQQNMKL